MAKLPHFTSQRDDVHIRGFSLRVKFCAKEPEVRKVVSALTFAHLDPGGREITDIGNFQHSTPKITVRLDRQGNTSEGAANLQVQVNDVALPARLNQLEKTTIAQVLVPPEVYQAAFTCRELTVRTNLERAVRSALLLSYASSGYQFTAVEG